MGVLYARKTPQDNFTPVSTMGVGIASQSQAGLMSVPDKIKLDGIDDEKLDEIADYIVEQGTSGIWTYRKWNSGIAECWGKDNIVEPITTSYSGVYVGTQQEYNYPFEFISIPTLAKTISTNREVSIFALSGKPDTTTSTGGTYACAFSSRSSANYNLNFYAKGTWK